MCLNSKCSAQLHSAQTMILIVIKHNHPTDTFTQGWIQLLPLYSWVFYGSNLDYISSK